MPRLGITVSALGNHEFDDGQRSLAEKWTNSPLRPKNWDITYVCANVRRNDTGAVPDFAQPVVSVPLTLPDGRPFRVTFVGLIASSTPQQASVRKLAGLSFDGNYPAVLDSVMHLPEGNLVSDANLRLLLTHNGTYTNEEGQPAWDDKDKNNLYKIDSPLWNGILSSHSHKRVCGYINQAHYPVVQGRWHGDYISMLLCTINNQTLKVTKVEPHSIRVTPKAHLNEGPARLQAQIDSLLQHTVTKGGTPIGTILTTAQHEMPHDRDHKYRQSEVGTLVCKAYAEAYRTATHQKDETPIIGCSHFGSIRAGFGKGKVSVLDVGEALPFSNALKVYHLTGKQIMSLVQFGLHNQRYGWLQTAYLDVVKDAEGNVEQLSYVSPHGYAPSFFPTKQEIKVANLPLTTDAFINYLKQQPSI